MFLFGIPVSPLYKTKHHFQIIFHCIVIVLLHPQIANLIQSGRATYITVQARHCIRIYTQLSYQVNSWYMVSLLLEQ